ncbi:hypothetical protein BC829DRAFT_69145 [Chytridium lagenaria]|nr:hypothetical protein BC829DRAFT_69145 [Chytridium lagenaria]
MANLAKSIYAVLTETPNLLPTMSQSDGLESMVEKLASTLADTVSFNPANVPVVTSALQDGIRVVVKVDFTNPTSLPVFLPGPFNLDLIYDSHIIGHILISNIRLAPNETYPHDIHVLYAPATPSAMIAGGQFLGRLAAGGSTGIPITVGVADIASLIRGLAVPDSMKKILWDAYNHIQDPTPPLLSTPPPSPPPSSHPR